MSEGDATSDPQAAVSALRSASARVAELDSAAPPSAEEVGVGPSLDPDFDVAVHAERFEELHDALSAVLATLDRA